VRPTPEQVFNALKTMRLAIAFVPVAEEDTAIILMSLGNMVGTKAQLDWLTYMACNVMAKWSLAELRGLYCTRYDPLDGVRAECTIPGYTPEDMARKNEAAPESDPTRLLASLRIPEPDPTQEERAEWVKLDLQIRNAAARSRLVPARRAPTSRPDLKSAEQDLANVLASIPKPSQEELARSVKELERRLGIVDGGKAVH
jgi:hypothetical protein